MKINFKHLTELRASVRAQWAEALAAQIDGMNLPTAYMVGGESQLLQTPPPSTRARTLCTQELTHAHTHTL